MADSSITVSSYNPLSISLDKDIGICNGERIILSPGDFKTYAWQNNSTDSNFTVVQPCTYHVSVTDTNGCVVKDTIKVFLLTAAIFFSLRHLLPIMTVSMIILEHQEIFL